MTKKVIGYAVDVIDLDKPEGKNIIWSSVKQEPMKYKMIFREIHEGEMLV